MDSYKLLITGGIPLVGETYVSGGKNTSVAVIAATLLCDEPCVLENLPLKDYKEYSPLFEEDVYDAISLKTCVEGRSLIGGPAPETVKNYLENL